MRRINKGRVALALGSAVAVAATGTLVGRAALAVPVTPTPAILSGPNAATTSRTASFSYRDTETSATFKCSLDAGSFSTCPSTDMTYSGLSEGLHTFRVEAQALTESMSAPASRTWAVDTTAPAVALSFPASGHAYNAAGWNASCPPSPGLCGIANDATGVAGVQVALLQGSSGKYWSGSGFTLASQVFQTATGTTSWRYPLPLSNLSDGPYVVSVRATDTLGNSTVQGQTLTAAFGIDTVAPPAPVITGGPDNSFGISGNASAAFYPGAPPQPLNLVLTNPFNFDIKVTGITVAIQAATTKNGNPNPGCDGVQNLKVTRQFNGTVTLAKKTTSSLSQLGTPSSQYPLLQMPDLSVNQDACQNSTFRMSYSGTAVKP